MSFSSVKALASLRKSAALRLASREISSPPRAYEHWKRRKPSTLIPQNQGTIGVVARDLKGNLAAATSTGGIAGKLRGRIGDSAIIGSGTYADQRLGAASST